MSTHTVNYKKRGEVLPLETNDLTAILALGIDVLERGKNSHSVRYENTEAGLDAFREKTLHYLRRVDEINKDLEAEKKLIPDLESWAIYCGICRKTLYTYQNRGGEWERFIRQVKDVFTAIKKQLAFRNKLPAIVLFFDLTNNSDYVNASEFKISAPEPEQKPPMRLEDIPELEAIEENNSALSELPEFDEGE